MASTARWAIALLAVAATLTGCSSRDDRSGKRRKTAGERKPVAAPAGPRPPTSRNVTSSIAGMRLRAWTTDYSTTEIVESAGLPAPVVAELTALLQPATRAEPAIQWAAVLTGSSGPSRSIAIAYQYPSPGGITYGFAVTANSEDTYVVNQAIELTTESRADIEPGTIEDRDGDSVPDVSVVYRQHGADPATITDAGLILLASRTATTYAIPMFRHRIGDQRVEELTPWGGCWTREGNRPILILLVHEQTLVRVDGKEQPLHAKYSSAVYAPDDQGKLVQTALYAGVLGSASAVAPLTGQWRDWIGDAKAEVPMAPDGAPAWDVAPCPRKKQLALVVPAGSTRPSGGDGYSLLAWPSLDRSVTSDGVTKAGLPISALVELGDAGGLR